MGYYNEKNIGKFQQSLSRYIDALAAGEALKVSISGSNSKMGEVASVSLLPFITCPGRCSDTCGAKCYAAKLAVLRPSVLNAYARNTAMAIYAPGEFWRQVRAAAAKVPYFRFEVSGDFLNSRYFAEVVKTAQELPGTEFLAFTKRYEVVNAWIDEHGALPQNLHILFSGWSNLNPDNPHGLPETTVFEREEEIQAQWKMCGGNCFNCACRGVGCWQAIKGDVIAFKMH